jgi:hypothetical protein
MTAVTAALAPAGQGLMDNYLGYLRGSGLGERAVRVQDSRHGEIFYAGFGRDLTS